jgi:hypothetical protein
MYDDDGISYDYEKGIYSLTRFEVTQSSGSKKTNIIRMKEGPYHYRDESWMFMTR